MRVEKRDEKDRLKEVVQEILDSGDEELIRALALIVAELVGCLRKKGGAE